jgi:hypothetical protein
MNIRDEIKAAWGKISDLDWRLTKARASIVPSTDPELYSFLDHFSDASIFWAWKTLATSGIKTIVEAGSVLTIATVGADARWAVATNLAPKVSIGHPGLPCEIITKINSVGLTLDGNTHTGLYAGTPEGVSTNSGIIFGAVSTGLRAYSMDGTSYNVTAVTTMPIWLKMRISAQVLVGYHVSFQYSTDGIAWTTYQHIPGTDFYWWGGTTPNSMNIGLVLRGTAAACTSTIPFEFFRSTRIFGPGGS